MRDVSTELAAWERPARSTVLSVEATDRLLDRIALLHAVPWSTVLTEEAARAGAAPPPWCPLAERLTLLTPVAATGYAAAGNPVGAIFLRGWDGFARHAPRGRARPGRPALGGSRPARGRARALAGARAPRRPQARQRRPSRRRRCRFIDWQMTLEAPVAVELGWFLVTNSAELPIRPGRDAAPLRHEPGLVRRSAGGRATGRHDVEGLVGDWDAQLDLAWIVGLLLRGWRKGADTARPASHSGPASPPADDLAWWAERAVEAAGRRL